MSSSRNVRDAFNNYSRTVSLLIGIRVNFDQTVTVINRKQHNRKNWRVLNHMYYVHEF
jgi:hypothetical protein